jgi:cob(I)alamin adenosyltransferase
MSRKTVVYTKTGDDGTTSLVDGSRKMKNDPRIEVYGTVDELNSWIGIVRSSINFEMLLLHCIQLELFNLASTIACPSEQRNGLKLRPLSSAIVHALEHSIDEMDSELPPLKNFILPAGTLAASHTHVARTVCRRLERMMISFNDQLPNEIPKEGMIFINRLSDFLFVLARVINIRSGLGDVNWTDGKQS